MKHPKITQRQAWGWLPSWFSLLFLLLAACSTTPLPNNPTLEAQLIDNCQAAVNGRNAFAGKTYFFDDSSYSRFDWATNQVEPGYPAPVAGNWPLPWRSFDAAVNSPSGTAYFFKGKRYVSYDWATNTASGIRPISAWHFKGAFANGVDAAVEGYGAFARYTYFFKGSHYVRYDWITDKTSSPAPLTAWHLPGTFANGVDLAVEGGPGFEGKTYFFKGRYYVRYDWATGIVSGPATIENNWPELTTLCGGPLPNPF
jgi:Hemopexin